MAHYKGSLGTSAHMVYIGKPKKKNSAKKIACRFKRTIWQQDGRVFSINLYETSTPVLMPNGKKVTEFVAKGNNLPCGESTVRLTGYFQKYNDSYTFVVKKCEKMKGQHHDN